MPLETLLIRVHFVILVPAALFLAGPACPGRWVQQVHAQETAPSKKPDTTPTPIVICNPLTIGSLGDAEKYLEKGDYKRALQIIETLMSQDNFFYPLPDGRSYTSIRVKVNDMVGKMKPDGLKLYKTIYDPRAEQLYRQAMESGSKATTLLQQLAYDYPHTSWGVKALLALAPIHMDGGRFSQAAHCWNLALKSISGDPSEPLILAKTAVASHLGGDPGGCQEAVEKLKKGFSQATAELGGKQQNLVDFVESFKARPIRQACARGVPGQDWHGVGAVPDGMALMGNCDVVLRPGWRFPEDDPQVPLHQRLCVSVGSRSPYSDPDDSRWRQDAKLAGGHATVRFTGSSGGTPRPYADMPPLIHPIVADQTVIFRDEKGVIAVDLLTGRQKWKNSQCPLGKSGLSYPNSLNLDSGRMTLTAGQGMVYTLMQSDPRKDIFCLVALDIPDQGRQKWKIGDSGDDDPVRNCRIFCAPTYHDGQLYLVSRYMGRFYLLCLRAYTGQLVWKTPICTTDFARYFFDMPPDVGTPPAVVSGRVIVATNSGVIASIDAGSGQPVWAYQYGILPVLKRGNLPPSPDLDPIGRCYTTGSPIIVSKGAVICLPADAQSVVALNLEDGRPLWPNTTRIRRGGCSELSAIDSDRFLLSGGNRLAVYSIIDGKKLGEWTAPKGQLQWPISGRPVVTRDSVLVSGEGVLYRMNHGDYSVSTVGKVEPDGLLGNLVVVDGNLIAANLAGVCLYFSRDRAKDIPNSKPKDAATKDSGAKPE
ncbi:MAG: PQQ-like beta-propeller repeat protein [Planctomycetes bacterium]|nr:PQQ-like beta-propeller repeat protein [Planctomycetota bacterium]